MLDSNTSRTLKIYLLGLDKYGPSILIFVFCVSSCNCANMSNPVVVLRRIELQRQIAIAVEMKSLLQYFVNQLISLTSLVMQELVQQVNVQYTENMTAERASLALCIWLVDWSTGQSGIHGSPVGDEGGICRGEDDKAR
ncbi:hypothetical protein U9M48_022868 [Paspalum notatum var. saurae]|uniref:Uncharacterized protein n=1 Tax=Paspalum notatum var. saurae TaxID=547442 RepID=A0AAQ3TKE7_PASNO